MSKYLIRVNLVLLVVFAVTVGATKILGLPAERELYLHVGLFGTPFIAFGFVQLGAGILIGSAPTRRIGATIFIATLLIGSYALFASGAVLVAGASLALLVLPGAVLWTTPRFAPAQPRSLQRAGR